MLKVTTKMEQKVFEWYEADIVPERPTRYLVGDRVLDKRTGKTYMKLGDGFHTFPFVRGIGRVLPEHQFLTKERYISLGNYWGVLEFALAYAQKFIPDLP